MTKIKPDTHRLAPGRRVRWDRFDAAACGDPAAKQAIIAETATIVAGLDPLQERLYAEGRRSLLVILQAIDTGGKDGVIRHVMRSLNPAPSNCGRDIVWSRFRAG